MSSSLSGCLPLPPLSLSMPFTWGSPGFWSWPLFPFEHLFKGTCPLSGAMLLPSAPCLHPALPHDLQTHIFCCSLCIFIKMFHGPLNIYISLPVISCSVQIPICYSVSWSGCFWIFQDMMPPLCLPCNHHILFILSYGFSDQILFTSPYPTLPSPPHPMALL